MSESIAPLREAAYAELRRRVFDTYLVVAVLCLAAIGLLVGYVLTLGTILGPGVEESFGLAVALLFLFGALMVHLVDRAYREWPEGRRVHPTPGRLLGEADAARLLKVAVVIGAVLLLAYLLGGILA
ncbi:MAG: hypothetical protein L3K04_01610 [Thermoplasmata archaeon]|nr:hypothetical protein [Thermoplasmata archaeon]MCI4341780.1 hypothetical protein [Thermoplasmata archaeon]